MNWYNLYKIADKAKYDISKIDWSKSSREISQENGIPLNYVFYLRKQNAVDTIKKIIRDYDGSKIDWNKSTFNISLETGLSYSAVRRLREKWSPNTVKHYDKIVNWKIIGPQIDWKNRRNIDIAIEYNVCPEEVSYYRSIYAPSTLRYRPTKYNWELADWNKSDGEIATTLIKDLIERHIIDTSEFSEKNVEILANYVSRVRYFRNKPKPQATKPLTSVASYNNWYKSSQLDNSLLI